MKWWYEFLNWLAREEIHKRDSEIRTLRSDLRIAYSNVEERNRMVKELDKQISQRDVEDFDYCEIDFEGLGVVSIERAYDKSGDRTHTVLGYLDGEGRAKEWFLNCSQKRHKELVEEFRSLYKNTNKS